MTCALCSDQEECVFRNQYDKCKYPPHPMARLYAIRANINADVELYVAKGSEIKWTTNRREAKSFKSPKFACDWMAHNDYGIVDYVVEQLYKDKPKVSRCRYEQ